MVLPKGIRQKIMVRSEYVIGGMKEVDAVVFGPLAVHKLGDVPHPAHPQVKTTNGYKITHVPTGKYVATLYGFHYARQVAQLMAIGLRWDFQEVTELSDSELDDLKTVLTLVVSPCYATPRSARETLKKQALKTLEAGVKEVEKDRS